MAPTPKERAVHLSEAGMSAQTVAAILGIDLADVKSLMTEADPDVELASGGGGTIPDVGGVKIIPEINGLIVGMDGGSVEEYSDLVLITAPTEADAYILQADVVLQSKDNAVAVVAVYVTDEETWNDWFNISGAPVPYYSEFQHTSPSATFSRVNSPLHMVVAAGAEAAFLVNVSDPEDASVGVGSACWVPLG